MCVQDAKIVNPLLLDASYIKLFDFSNMSTIKNFGRKLKRQFLNLQKGFVFVLSEIEPMFSISRLRIDCETMSRTETRILLFDLALIGSN